HHVVRQNVVGEKLQPVPVFHVRLRQTFRSTFKVVGVGDRQASHLDHWAVGIGVDGGIQQHSAFVVPAVVYCLHAVPEEFLIASRSLILFDRHLRLLVATTGGQPKRQRKR